MIRPNGGPRARTDGVTRRAQAEALEVHRALADDTRFRLYRHMGLAGRPVSVRELATRLSLHPNTLRPHLRRLEDAGLVTREIRRGSGVGRPQTMFALADVQGAGGRDLRLLADILAGLLRGRRAAERARALAREWGSYLVSRGLPKPGVPLPPGRNLALLQGAMAGAGFQPRFRRTGGGSVEVALRDCPFREMLEDHRELVCGIHRGLLEGMLESLKPPLELREFKPFAERSVCRFVAHG